MIAILAVIATLVAEALAVYTVAELVAATYPDEASNDAVRPVIFVFLSLLAFSLPRVVAALAPPPRLAFAMMATVTFVAIYGAFRVEFAGDFRLYDFSWLLDYTLHGSDVVDIPRPITSAILIVFAWARSTWRSVSDVEFESTPRQIAGPAGIVIVACILGVASERDELIARGALAFFGVAIVALAFSQSALSGATFGEVRTGGITTTLLIGSSLAAIGGVVAFGVVFGVFGELVAAFLGDMVRFALYLTVLPIVVAAEWFVGLFDFEAGKFDPPEQGGSGQPLEDEEDEQADRGPIERSILVALRFIALGVGLAVLVGVVLAVAGRWRRYRRAADASVTVSRTGSIREDMGSLLARLFRHGPASRPESDDRVVRLYQHVLSAAHDRGHDRFPGQTPAEFAPVLRGTFEDRVTDDVTNALVEDLYGSRPLPPNAVDDLERRWRARADAP